MLEAQYAGWGLRTQLAGGAGGPHSHRGDSGASVHPVTGRLRTLTCGCLASPAHENHRQMSPTELSCRSNSSFQNVNSTFWYFSYFLS